MSNDFIAVDIVVQTVEPGSALRLNGERSVKLVKTHGFIKPRAVVALVQMPAGTLVIMSGGAQVTCAATVDAIANRIGAACPA